MSEEVREEFKKSTVMVRLTAYTDENIPLLEKLLKRIVKIVEEEGFKIADEKVGKRRYGGVNIYIYLKIPEKAQRRLRGRGWVKNLNPEGASRVLSYLGLELSSERDRIEVDDPAHYMKLAEILPPELVFADAVLHSREESETIVDAIAELVRSYSAKVPSELAFTVQNMLKEVYDVKVTVVELSKGTMLTTDREEVEKLKRLSVKDVVVLEE